MTNLKETGSRKCSTVRGNVSNEESDMCRTADQGTTEQATYVILIIGYV